MSELTAQYLQWKSTGNLVVQCSKLPEWLLSRRVIPEDYGKLLSAVEVKTQEAMAESIEDEATKVLIEEHKDTITYFSARDIYNTLVKSEQGRGKSLLGVHTDPAAAKWKAVLDAYKRRHLGWASEVRLLIQSAIYEIPALKKQAAACEKHVADCNLRQTELTHADAHAKARYDALLKEQGIEGVDPRGELLSQARAELPKIYAELAEAIRHSGSVLADYYETYALHGLGLDPDEKSDKSESKDVVPLMRVMAGKDEASLQELGRQVPALRELRESAAAAAARKAATASQGNGGPHGDIDWGIEVSASGEGGGEAATEAAGKDTAGNGDINWGEWSIEGGEAKEASAAHSTAGGEGGGGGGGLLADSAFRELLHREVLEVSSFLQERCAELSAGGPGGHVDVGPRNVDVTLEMVKGYAEAAGRMEELLSGGRTQRLQLLQSSQRYLDQAVKRVEVAKVQCAKPATQRGALDQVKAEQSKEAKRTHEEMEKLRAQTQKRLQELEKELSTHFKTEVRIGGEAAQL